MLGWDDDAPQFLSPDERELLARKAVRRDEARKRREEREARDREWQERFDLWRLTPFESRLVRAVEDGPCDHSESRFTVLRKVYGISLSEQSDEKDRRRYFARLRKLQQRVNDKLRLARASYEVKPCKGDFLSLVYIDAEEQREQAAPKTDDAAAARLAGLRGRDAIIAELRRKGVLPMPVEECEQRLRTFLADGPVPAWKVNQKLANDGCRPGTLKKARKRLGVVAQREGFGGNGEWLLSLPG